MPLQIAKANWTAIIINSRGDYTGKKRGTTHDLNQKMPKVHLKMYYIILNYLNLKLNEYKYFNNISFRNNRVLIYLGILSYIK